MCIMPEPPPGSSIKLEMRPEGNRYEWGLPGMASNLMRFLIGGFLIIWLCGWAAGDALK